MCHDGMDAGFLYLIKTFAKQIITLDPLQSDDDKVVNHFCGIIYMQPFHINSIYEKLLNVDSPTLRFSNTTGLETIWRLQQ